MEIVIAPAGGLARCLYAEAIDLRHLGELQIRRASHVEPDGRGGGWRADLSPVGGPCLGPFRLRSEALAAETAWLSAHWLMSVRLINPERRALRMRAVLILTLFVLAMVFVGCLDAYLAERRAASPTGSSTTPNSCAPATTPKPVTRPEEARDEGARRDRAVDGHVGAGAGGVRPGAAGGGGP
jgi:hypothetical protein